MLPPITMPATKQRDRVADALLETLISPNVCDSNLEAANVVDALDGIGRAIRHGLKWLGTGDAATPMGAIEAHGSMVIEAAEKVEAGLESIARALDGLAEAIRERD